MYDMHSGNERNESNFTRCSLQILLTDLHSPALMNAKRKATSSLSAAVTSSSAPKKLKQGSLTAFFGSPSGNKDLHTAAKVRFDKQAWINSLTPSLKELLKYVTVI